MIRSLKVALILYGAIHVLFGFGFIVAPQLVGSISGFDELAPSALYVMAMLGGGFIAVSFLLIVTGLNPLEHISGLKFAILWSVLGVVTQLYSVLQGVVDFSQAGTGIICDAVFAIAFLALYPYRRQ
ncbi:MAG: hypothetical protein V1932_04545 [Chloroflexota bacterium]